jgi:sporulation protein YlmC with PRC-barrel domain
MSMAEPLFSHDTDPVSSGTSSSSLISAGRVQGTAVYNTKGDHLGHVEDIMLHKVSGKVAYALMAFGGFLGIGEKYHPLPWSMLKYDIAQEGYVVPLDKNSLKGAPSYERSEFDYDDAEWRERVHDYYKAAPYWGL